MITLTDTQIADLVAFAERTHAALHAEDESVSYDMALLSGLIEYVDGMIDAETHALGVVEWALGLEMGGAVMSADFLDMDDFDSAPVRAQSPAAAKAKVEAPTVQCPRCRGTGRVTWGYVNIQSGDCRQCKGTGLVRADWEKRRAAFVKGETTKANNKRARTAQWRAGNPVEALWIDTNAGRFEFADSMQSALVDYGRLTDGQLAAVRRCIIKDEDRASASKKAQEATAVGVAGAGTDGLTEALRKAKAKGLKYPAIRVEGMAFSLAPDHGRNAGAVYVKSGDLYLGKVLDGRYFPSRDGVERSAQVALVLQDPLTAAIAYGKEFGICSCCGRTLTDPVSIAKGIGPICEGNFF